MKRVVAIIQLRGCGNMKIFYKQTENDCVSSLSRFGVQNCYLKKLMLTRDQKSVTKKPHHHTGFEIHIVTEGFQEYEVQGRKYTLNSGCFLIIYPGISHTVISSAPNTCKYSITFDKHTEKSQNCCFGSITKRIVSNLDYISGEVLIKKEISAILIENSIFEILAWAFRLSGMEENTKKQDENALVLLAKRYIDDNIERAPCVEEVSEYCYLSTKQLTRIFHRFEDVSPGEYIINRRIAKIEKLLSDSSLSLKQISEIMNFNNEYYFNAFFKKHSGMPPGEYRKMLGQ